MQRCTLRKDDERPTNMYGLVTWTYWTKEKERGKREREIGPVARRMGDAKGNGEEGGVTREKGA